MSVQHAHTKLIHAAARDILRPIGLTQKGRSRTWLDDQGWWLGVVEFQSSSSSRGSYLNVGVNWLWDEKDYVSFDVGYRVKLRGGISYIEYEDDEQFEPLARQMAIRAADEVRKYRIRIDGAQGAASLLRSVSGKNLLALIDEGIAWGLCGEAAAARRAFSPFVDFHESGTALAAETDDSNESSRQGYKVDKSRYERAVRLSRLADDTERFRQEIAAEVHRGRARLKLDPEVELAFGSQEVGT